MKLFDEQIVLWLCVGGFVLVMLSEQIGLKLVTRPYGSSGWRWNEEDAHRVAEVLRWLGAMLFAAGLVERLLRAVARRGDP